MPETDLLWNNGECGTKVTLGRGLGIPTYGAQKARDVDDRVKCTTGSWTATQGDACHSRENDQQWNLASR